MCDERRSPIECRLYQAFAVSRFATLPNAKSSSTIASFR